MASPAIDPERIAPAGSAGPAGRAWVWPAGLVLLAMAVRGVVLWEASRHPFFHAPAIDAARYDALARQLASGGGLDAAFFWQPSLYPLLLGLVYWLVGPSLVAARLLGVAIAGATTLVTFRLGERVGGRSVGAWAAGIYALYGPAVFFETELEAAGLAALLGVALPLAALWAEERRRPLPFLVWGLVGGLAVWCRPELGLAVLGVGGWLLWKLLGPARGELARRRGALLGAVGLVGLLVVLTPVTVITGRHTGSTSPLPLSGGLNLWLGNAPDLCDTLTIRPGERWQRLMDEPLRAKGERSPTGQERYFLEKTGESIKEHPLGFVGGLGRKALRLVASRELPRNVDVYEAREDSALLSLLVWRLGAFGFPLGLLLPLAALGLACERRRLPAPLWLALVGTAIALVIVFPTARHRLPMLPMLAVLAALGGLGLWRAARARQLRSIWPGSAAGLALLALGTLPGRFCEERGPWAAERHMGAGVYLERHGRPDEARTQYEAALRHAPALHEARVNLGALRLRKGDAAGALGLLDAAVAGRPKSAQARLGRALVLLAEDRVEAAIRDLAALVRIEPWAPAHRFLLGQALGRARRFRESEAAFRAAWRRAPDDPQILNALAWLATGRDDPSLRRPDEAVRLARRACALTGHRDPSLIDTLAAAEEAAGRPEQAAALYDRALDLARRQGKADLARDIETRRRALGRPGAGSAGPPPTPPPGP